VTTTGQVTIPKAVRDLPGLTRGNAGAFERAEDGRVILVKVGGARRPSRLEALRSYAGPGPATDEIMPLTRGDAPA
jgi:AbrB family looped-hinge helix DNA binding protein